MLCDLGRCPRLVWRRAVGAADRREWLAHAHTSRISSGSWFIQGRGPNACSTEGAPHTSRCEQWVGSISLSLPFISIPSTAAPNLQALLHLLDEPSLFLACFQSFNLNRKRRTASALPNPSRPMPNAHRIQMNIRATFPRLLATLSLEPSFLERKSFPPFTQVGHFS